MDNRRRTNAGTSASRHRSCGNIVETLLAQAPAFADLVADREIEYHASDDYGIGGIWLAALRGGRFTWTGQPDYRAPD